ERAEFPSRAGWVLLTTALVAAMAWFLPLAYGANDDSGVLLSLATPPGVPGDPLLTPLAPSFATTLNEAYQRFPEIPWYGLSLAIANAVATGLILHAFARAPLDRRAKAIVFPAMLVLLIDCLFFWTFTKAMLLLQLGAFLQVLVWQRGCAGERFPYLAVIFALLFGYCFRWHFFYLTLAFAFPIAVYLRPAHLKPLAIVAAVVGLAMWGDHFVYGRLKANDALYREYEEFHFARYPFHDLPEGYPNSHTPEALAAAGWKQEDYEFFRKLWGIYDDEAFNAKTLRTFLAENRKGLQLSEAAKDLTGSPWAQVMHHSFVKNWPFLAAIFVPAVLLFGAVGRGGPEAGGFERWRRLAILAGFLALVGYLFINRFPIRVSGPTFLYLLVVLAAVAPRTTARRRYWLVLLALAGVAGFAWDFTRTLTHYRASNAGYREFLGKLGPDIAARKVLLVTDCTQAFSPEMIHPIFDEKQFDRGMTVVPCGTKVNSPLYKRFLERHGYASGRDLMRDALRGDRTLFFSFNDEPTTEGYWLSYLNRRFAKEAGGKVKFETIAENANSAANGSRPETVESARPRMAILKLVPDKSASPGE
ncbi:MAG TPA: hypothetical protein VNC50_15635, partial [Planctomycetia bacterium]|nr:hypothetical protein [Planctomycetia bacterium]